MFARGVYEYRPGVLTSKIEGGLLLVPATVSAFWQDSTILYYFGLDQPGLTAVIDVDGKTHRTSKASKNRGTPAAGNGDGPIRTLSDGAAFAEPSR